MDGTSVEELEELALARRLTDLDGVGDTTARVITEALAGETPPYLTELESSTWLPELSDGARTIRSRLRGDCHSHSEWSDGGSTIEEMAEAAHGLGHDYLALTDHSPRLTVAHGLDKERLAQPTGRGRRASTSTLAPFRILTGIEVDILEDGSLDQEDELLDRLDVVWRASTRS